MSEEYYKLPKTDAPHSDPKRLAEFAKIFGIEMSPEDAKFYSDGENAMRKELEAGITVKYKDD